MPIVSPSTESLDTKQNIFPIREYIDIIRQRKWGFILAFVITSCLGVAYTLRQPKIYEATTAVIINPEPQTITPLESTATEQWYMRDTYYDTQLKVMQSRNVAQRVVDDLGLASNIEFLGLENIKDPAIIEQRIASADPVSLLTQKLRIESITGTRLVKIHVKHKNPQMAAMLANAIATAYSEQNSEQRLVSLNNTHDFIDKQYKDNQSKLEQARDSLNAFKENHAILYSNPIEQQKITNQRLDYLNNKKIEIETQKLHAGYILSELENVPLSVDNVRAFDMLVESTSLEAAMADCKSIEHEMNKLLITYLEKSPQVTALKSQHTACKNYVLSNMKNILTGAKAKYQALVKLNREIDQEIEKLKKEALELDQLRLLYEQFESQKEEQERLFEQSQKKLNEVRINQLLEVNNIRILDKAIIPQAPVSPNILINAFITLFASFIMGILAVLIAELLDISVRTQNDVEQRARLPFLGSVPKFPKSHAYTGRAAYRFILENPRSPVAESVRTLRTTLSFQLKDDQSHVLLVTSAQPLEGKTMTSINLAVTAAQSGQRVALIEADLRRPHIFEALKIKPETGLSAVINKTKSLSDAIVDTEIKNLKLLPCGDIPPNPAELFDTKEFEQLLTELRQKFDLIVIDSPPVTVVTDALIIARYVHGVIVIARAEKTPIPLLIRTRELLEGVNAPIMGVVLNDMSSHARGYYGGYYYYHKTYKEYK